MLNESEIIKKFRTGRTCSEIASELHVNVSSIRDIIKPLNYPTAKIIRKILKTEGFSEWFTSMYISADNVQEIYQQCLEHPFFNSIRKTSISKRMIEVRNYLGLAPKQPENQYACAYDRIRGYIVRNSKFCAKRRGIEFNITYKDFELPKYCPILGLKLEYGAGNDGNAPQHATLDRIDNTKGYLPGNIMIISRLANAMKNEASFENLQQFINNYSLLINYVKMHGTLGNITDIFPHWEKLSLDS
jgi:hypothetical protein